MSHPNRRADSISIAGATCFSELARRLKFYRLRAKVTLDERAEDLTVIAGWGDATAPQTALAAGPDPRLAALGWRAIVKAG